MSEGITIRYDGDTNQKKNPHLIQRRVFLRQAALLDDGGVKEKLPVGPLHDLLLHRPLRDEAEHLHRLRLPDAVGAVHGLKVHLTESAVRRVDEV